MSPELLATMRALKRSYAMYNNRSYPDMDRNYRDPLGAWLAFTRESVWRARMVATQGKRIWEWQR